MLLSREMALVAAAQNLGLTSTANFFEMVRIDLVVDQNLDVYIMEVPSR